MRAPILWHSGAVRRLALLACACLSACLAGDNPLFDVLVDPPAAATTTADAGTTGSAELTGSGTADATGTADASDSQATTDTTDAPTTTPGECAGDETRPCYTGPETTRGVGRCRAGDEVCLAGQWSGACVGEVLPVAEDCDTVDDDDCDGVVNDGCDDADCDDGEQQACYTGPAGTKDVGLCEPGQSTCLGGQWGPCEGQTLPADELCDPPGADEDCNDKVDETCDECEIGSFMNCYEGPPGTEGVGVCHGGVTMCKDGSWGPCMGQALPGIEDCDSPMDEDCDSEPFC